MTVAACSASAFELEAQSWRERLDNGTPDWTTTSLFYRERDLTPRWSALSAGVTRYSRYGRRAHEAAGAAAWTVRRGLALELLGSVAEGADFIANWSVGANVYAGLPGGLELTTGVLHRDYALDASTLARVQLDREFGAWRLGFGVAQELAAWAPSNTRTAGVVAKYTSGSWAAALRLSTGREAERDAAGAPLTFRTHNVTADVQKTLSEDWQLRLGASRTVGGANRTGWQIAVSRRF